jgi:6-phosphogluconolactonase
MMKASILIGTYTSGGNSQGIYEAELDLRSGALGGACLAVSQKEPSYLTLSRDGKRLYAVEETVPSGRVFSYQQTSDGWIQTGVQQSCGSAPCHVMLDEETNTLAVANYMNGAVSFYVLDAMGALQNSPQTIVMDGKGVNIRRQECAHAHQCVKYGDKVLVNDLGTDRVRVFHRDAGGIYAEEAPLVHVRPGAGPRHMVLSQDGTMLYILCELENTLYAFRNTGMGFTEQGVYEYLPKNAPQSSAAAIRLSHDERYLFVTSRGGFSGVALFELDNEKRLPVLRDVCASGAIPRDILPVGDYLLCACQDANAVQVMRLDRAQLRLAVIGEMAVPRPVCLVLKNR